MEEFIEKGKALEINIQGHLCGSVNLLPSPQVMFFGSWDGAPLAWLPAHVGVYSPLCIPTACMCTHAHVLSLSQIFF